MKLSELIKQLLVLEAKHGPDLEVQLSADDSYYGNTNHTCCGASLENGFIVLMDSCNFDENPDHNCPGKHGDA